MKRLLLASMLVSLVGIAMAQAQQQDQPANTVSVLGQVRRPGIYQVTADRSLSLTQAIALAQGFTMDADKKKVEITRNGEPEKITVDLQAILLGKVPDVPLKAGDVIRVPALRR